MRFRQGIIIDDKRTPNEALQGLDIDWDDCGEWWLSPNYFAFQSVIAVDGVPDFVTFDHDLADFVGDREYTGADCAKFLIELCHTENIKFPEYRIHSANGPGRLVIESLIESAKRAGYIY